MAKKDKDTKFLLVSKLSTATVYGKVNVKELIKTPNETIKIMRIYGIAKRIITGSTNFGDWTGFSGSFEAVNITTGEMFASGKCFLPVNVSNMLSGQFVKDVETVRFGFEISAKYNEKNACKYEYLVSSLIKPQEDNPIALLRGEVDGTKK